LVIAGHSSHSIFKNIAFTRKGNIWIGNHGLHGPHGPEFPSGEVKQTTMTAMTAMTAMG
jgi:hypothetical protein